jgi:hypothetical protein
VVAANIPAPTTLPAAPAPAVPAPATEPNNKPMAEPQPDAPDAAPGEPDPRIIVPMQYASTEGIVLRYDRTDAHWYVEPRRAELHAGEILATPEPYEGEFDFDNGMLRATLLSDSVAEILPATPEHRVRLRLHRGRMMVTTGPAVIEPATTSLELIVDDRSWVFELGSKAECAVERSFVFPTGSPAPIGTEMSRLAAYGIAGSIQVLGPQLPSTNVPSREIVWLSRPMLETDQVVQASPTWLDPKQRHSSMTLKRYAMLFEREFQIPVPIDQSIPALMKDPRPKIAELAVRCLGTTESADELVAALARSEHPEARAAAAMGLRVWLIQDPARAELLQEQLRRHYPGDESHPIYRMLLGYSRQDATDPINSRMLVDWLRSSYVEVRELAIEQLERLTGRRYDYRPLSSASLREAGVQRWLGHLDREGALIKPAN